MKESDICTDRYGSWIESLAWQMRSAAVKVNQGRKAISRLSPRIPTKFHIHHSSVALIVSCRHGRPRQAQAQAARCPRAAAAPTPAAAAVGGRGEEGFHAPDVPLPPRRQRLRRRSAPHLDRSLHSAHLNQS